MTTKNELTLEEFLALPQEDGIYELIDGEAVFKVSPKEFHSALTLALTNLLTKWAQGRGRVRLEWAQLFSDLGKLVRSQVLRGFPVVPTGVAESLFLPGNAQGI